jgi:drug/metabolite transporter (DMT)-like permease
MMRLTPLRTLAVAALMSGIGPVLVRESPVGPAATAFWRMAIALPFAIWTGRFAFSMAARDRGLATMSGLLLAADLVFWNNAILRTSVMEATVLVMMFPLIVAVCEIFVLGRRLSTKLIFGGLIALTGTAVIATGKGPGHHDPVGDIMALAAAFFYAASLLISAQLCQRNEASGVTFWVILGAAAGTLPFAFSEPVLLPGSGGGLAYLSVYGLLTYGSYALYNSTLSKLPTTLVAISGYGQPIIASSLAAIFLNEIPSWTSFLGALIIVSGLVLATKP